MYGDQQASAPGLGLVAPLHRLDGARLADEAPDGVGDVRLDVRRVGALSQAAAAAGAPLCPVFLPGERLVLVVGRPGQEDRVSYSAFGAVVELGCKSWISLDLRTVKGTLAPPSWRL